MVQVTHFGPGVDVDGGMAAVVRTLVETAPYACTAITTWSDRASRASNISSAVHFVARLGRPRRDRVLHAHLSERGSFAREGLALVAASRLGHRTVATLHGADFLSWQQSSRRAHQLAQTVLRHADATFSLFDEMRDFCSVTAPRGTHVTICNPVVDSSFGAWPKGDGLRVAFVGSRMRRKGLDVLLEAWPSISSAVPAHLCIAGPSGDVVASAEVSIEDLGTLNHHESRRLIASADLLVLPSSAEALPMVLLEAMSSAVPFLANDVAGIGRLAASGGGELLYDRSAVTLARQAIALLDDLGRRQILGAAGRAWWSQNAAPATVHAEIGRVYDALVASPRRINAPC